MNIQNRIINTLRQLDRSIRARGLKKTLSSGIKILAAEGLSGVRSRFHSLGPATRPNRNTQQKSALIITTMHTLHFANRLLNILKECGFHTSVSDNDRDAKHFDIIIAFAPHVFPNLPVHKTIAFQIEPYVRIDRWTAKYLDRLCTFKAVFDYSTTNIERLKKHVPSRKIFYVPFSPPPEISVGTLKRQNVLFYGDISSPRRKQLLSMLQKEIPNLKVVNNAFGAEIDAQLEQAAIVLNIHSVAGAPLETARISEAISAGAIVISETAPDQNDYPEISSRAIFVQEGDVNSIINIATQLMDDGEALVKAREAVLRPMTDKFRLYALRALQGLEIISPDTFDRLARSYPSALHTPTDNLQRICLTLPESAERKRNFLEKHDGFVMWPGLKANPGWRGCALSYRHLMRSFQDANISEVLIVEDDVILPHDFERRIILARKLMSEQDADLFSGMIVDIHKDTQILSVEEIEGITFVTLDRAVMTICNIYRTRMIDWLSKWDEKNYNAFTNTIDRYMETATHLKVITTLPFTVEYERAATSTLRDSDNDAFDELLRRSTLSLAEKVSRFKSKSTVKNP